MNEWTTTFFLLIEELFVKMKNDFHRQIGFQEFPKVNNDIVHQSPALSSWGEGTVKQTEKVSIFNLNNSAMETPIKIICG